MKDKYFIDTDIFVYAFDKTNPDRKDLSNQIIKNALVENCGCISYQVIQEFIHAATTKFAVPLSLDDCRTYLDRVLSPLCEIFTSLELYQMSLEIMERWQHSFTDSSIVAAALQSNCTILYSTELPHDQKIFSVTVRNPYVGQ